MMHAPTWIKKITPHIFDELSLSDQGTIPPFKLEEFTESLKAALNFDDLSISIDKMDFIDAEGFFQNLSNKTINIPLSLHPLSGQAFFIMGSNDVKSLCGHMVTEEEASPLSLQDDEMVKGFYTYFLTEAIDCIHTLGIYKDLSIKIVDGALTDLSAFAIDLSIKIGTDILPARLVITKALYKAIQNHFSFIPPTLENLEQIPDVNIPVSINTGSITFKRSEWKNIQEGDFIIVDNTFYKPLENKGSFQMLIGNTPIMQMKMAKDGIKVLDYLYFYNEDTMDEDDIFSDDNSFLNLDDNEFQGLNNEHSESNHDEGLNEEIDNEIDEDLDDDLDQEEELSDDKMLSPEKTNLSDVPLTVNLELARFSMSLEQMKKMSPGFKLPVTINPLHVNLVVGGKSIGTGEIIQIGDTTGVKITELNN